MFQQMTCTWLQLPSKNSNPGMRPSTNTSDSTDNTSVEDQELNMTTLQSVEQKLSKLSEIMNTNQKQIYNMFVNWFQSIHHQNQITPTSFGDNERTHRLPLNTTETVKVE